MRLLRATLLFSILTGCQMFAQAPKWDTSGNGLLTSTGTYYFREVTWSTSASNEGGLADAQVLYGTMTFNGSAPGTYAMAATYLEGASGGGPAPPQAVSGTYSMGAGGYGFISDPLQNGVSIRGMVANGIFIGSATDSSGYNNLFIAGLIPSSTPTTSTFSGAYTMAYANFASSNPQYFEDAGFTLSSSGSGTVSQSAMVGNYAGNYVCTTTCTQTPTGQAASSLKYTVTNGAVVLNFPTSSAATLVNGQEYLYFSPDGNFVFGGSPIGFDMLIGVKNTTSSTLTSPLYYNAGVYTDSATSCSNYDLVSYFGSFEPKGGTMIKHQRLFSSECSGTYNYVSTDNNPSNDPTETYTVGDGGNVRIGLGVPPFLGIDIALAAPSFSGSGIYIFPDGVLNFGRYAPFTLGVSPGEIVSIFGTNLSTSTAQATAQQVASQLPTTLGTTEVLIDGIPIPLYYVSSGEITAVVPYDVNAFSVANIQVKSNGVLSNLVSEAVYLTTPGAPTYPVPNGITDVAAERYDAAGDPPSIITESNPAQPGDIVSVYVTGLGTVFPTVADGAPPNQNYAVNTIDADISGTPVTVSYAGLSGYPGLYQIVFTLPTGLTAGDNFFDIQAFDPSGNPNSYVREALIPIGTSGAAAVTSNAAAAQGSQAQKAGKRLRPRPTGSAIVQQP